MEKPIPPFNLLDEPWLPCVIAADGTAAELSLRDALVRAHDIRELADPSPLVTVALHRLLLAVLHRNFGPESPAAWSALWNMERFDAVKLDAYFAKWRVRFNLFDPEWPFYQSAKVHQHAKSVAYLIHGLTLGNPTTLFAHNIDDSPPDLSPAAGARSVAGIHPFALFGRLSFMAGEPGATYGSASGGPLVSGAVVLIEGRTLFETLLLNLHRYSPTDDQPFSADPGDSPAWEQESAAQPKRRPVLGYLDLLTWQSRRVRLVPEITADGRTVVRKASLMKGWQFPDDWHPADGETMVAYRANRKAKEDDEPWNELRFDEDRALWRNSSALYFTIANRQAIPRTVTWVARLEHAELLPPTTVYRLSVVGQIPDQKKLKLWRREWLPLPLSIVDDPTSAGRIARALYAAEQAGRLFDAGSGPCRGQKGRLLDSPVQTLALALLAPATEFASDGMPNPSKHRRPDQTTISELIKSLQVSTAYWSRLELPFSRLVAELGMSNDEGTVALANWGREVDMAARDAMGGALAGFETSLRGWKAAALARRAFDWQLARCLGEFRADAMAKEGLDAVAP